MTSVFQSLYLRLHKIHCKDGSLFIKTGQFVFGNMKVKGNAVRRVVTIFLILLVFLAVPGCKKETDLDKVKKVVTEIQSAGEVKDVSKIMKHLSKNYSDPQGFNYEGIKGLLIGYFLRYPKISAYISNLTISVEKESARAEFQTVLTSGEKTGSIKDVIPTSLGVWDFSVTLKKESNEWKVTSAKWEESEMMNTGE